MNEVRAFRFFTPPTSVERAFRVGSTRQLVLSSYAGREPDPSRAAELFEEAHELW